MLLELINATLCKRPLNEKVFEGATETDWQQCYDIALAQGVLAMTFPAMSSLPKALRPTLQIWAQWMAYTQSIVDLSHHKRDVVKQIGNWLADDGLATTIIKGFSLSALYPNPNLREFSDIDIFSGSDYEGVNACFAKHGVMVDNVDGHHAYLNMEGVSIEHHFAFSNTKVKNGLEGPEDALQQLVVTAAQPTAIKGVCFPCPAFTVLFVGYHAYEHFLQEKIQIRHIIDWALALRQLNEEGAEMVYKEMVDTQWGYFLHTMTAIAMHQLILPQEWFPQKMVESALKIDNNQELRVWNDMLYTVHIPKSKSSNFRRILIAKRMLKNSWKFKQYADIKAHQFIWREFVGHLATK